MTLSNWGQCGLIIGAASSAAAAVAHLVCIGVGAPAYRLLGAGERIARRVEAGDIQPHLLTLAIAAVLFSWSAYALSGAGILFDLPFTRIVLTLITGIYLARAVAFPFVINKHPGNSMRFWLVSSAICGLIGLLHLMGVVALWHE
ncbi:hypothetical protein [Diaphorobacter aerolatus]|uniref:Uncharacterized protein n=1 Tax=Diaphorobacter aerolatus TaxID=1288495 RepID=A0A7H0GGI7_9BURK|nr:hypothetical protein [Diaphorobacter aerolatus]QNP47403.1 hypothetical protein H9K75_13895 [Diaphorobacter aerolatus]